MPGLECPVMSFAFRHRLHESGIALKLKSQQQASEIALGFRHFIASRSLEALSQMSGTAIRMSIVDSDHCQ